MAADPLDLERLAPLITMTEQQFQSIDRHPPAHLLGWWASAIRCLHAELDAQRAENARLATALTQTVGNNLHLSLALSLATKERDEARDELVGIRALDHPAAIARCNAMLSDAVAERDEMRRHLNNLFELSRDAQP